MNGLSARASGRVKRRRRRRRQRRWRREGMERSLHSWKSEKARERREREKDWTRIARRGWQKKGIMRRWKEKVSKVQEKGVKHKREKGREREKGWGEVQEHMNGIQRRKVQKAGEWGEKRRENEDENKDIMTSAETDDSIRRRGSPSTRSRALPGGVQAREGTLHTAPCSRPWP